MSVLRRRSWYGVFVGLILVTVGVGWMGVVQAGSTPPATSPPAPPASSPPSSPPPAASPGATSAPAGGSGGSIPTIIPSKPPGSLPDLATIINRLFNFGIIAAAVIFVILFAVGGISYLTSAGNEQGTTKAKKLIVDAIIGLVIVLAAWAVGNFVLDRFGVNVSVR